MALMMDFQVSRKLLESFKQDMTSTSKNHRDLREGSKIEGLKLAVLGKYAAFGCGLPGLAPSESCPWQRLHK